MKDKEGQPSGPNPEWEINHGQNIVIAEKINKLLLKRPVSLKQREQHDWQFQHRLEYLEEIQDIEGIGFLERQRHTIGNIPDNVQDAVTVNELIDLTNVNNKYRYILLGVGYSPGMSKKHISMGFMIDILPKGFNWPVYMLEKSTDAIEDDSPKFYVSSLHGRHPNDIIGADGLYYKVDNTYCFNKHGQGLKVEEITKLGTLEDNFDKKTRRLAERKLRMDFVPSKEHSRVVPLGPEDYEKINSMFEEIDAGLYQYKE